MSNKSQTSVGLVSLGCSKNLVDTQIMCGVLLTEGIALANPDEADIVLINTCAFIQAARDEAAFEINRACELKERGAVKCVVVTGCLAQRYGKSLANQFPLVDAWLGIDQLEKIADVVKSAKRAKHGKPFINVTPAPSALFEPRIPTFRLTNGPFAYLKIADGCNHACAYCAIPGIRGHLRSRSVDNIEAEARELLDTGVKELDIVAQDVTAYGRDAHDAARLPELLRRLNSIRGRHWLRILYGYPSLVDEELIDCFKSLRHLCKYIDIPIQHSHPDILRAMRRADTIESVQTLPQTLRKKSPDIVLRTTCMVGFPGETDEHFDHLYHYLKDARFDNLGVFIFSPEEGTAAAKIGNAVPPEIAQARYDKLMRLQKRIALENNKLRIGKTVEALLLQPLRNGRFLARTAWQAPEVDGITTVTDVPPTAHASDFVKVKITAATGYDLKAKML